jgi:hypothetical protein
MSLVESVRGCVRGCIDHCATSEKQVGRERHHDLKNGAIVAAKVAVVAATAFACFAGACALGYFGFVIVGSGSIAGLIGGALALGGAVGMASVGIGRGISLLHSLISPLGGAHDICWVSKNNAFDCALYVVRVLRAVGLRSLVGGIIALAGAMAIPLAMSAAG